MQLRCNKCHHQWNEDDADELAVVQCPECMVVIPIVVARGAGGGTSTAPKPAESKHLSTSSGKAADPPRKTPSPAYDGERTVIERPSPTVKMPSPVKAQPAETSEPASSTPRKVFAAPASMAQMGETASDDPPRKVFTSSGAAPKGSANEPAAGQSGKISAQKDAALACHRCSHSWREDIEDGQGVVQCPECMAVIPAPLALKGGAAAAPPKTAPKPTPKAEPPPAPPRNPAGPPKPETPRRPTPIPGAVSPVAQRSTPGATPPSALSKTMKMERDEKTLKMGGAGKSPASPPSASTERKPTPPPLKAPAPKPPPQKSTPRPMGGARGGAIGSMGGADLEGTMRMKADVSSEDKFLEAVASGKTNIVDDDVSEQITIVGDTSAPKPAKVKLKPTEKSAPDLSTSKTTRIPHASRATSAREEEPDDEPPMPWEERTRTGGPIPASELPTQTGEDAGELKGRVIGGYEILRKLGEGGMGEVCLARQISLDREVALKLLPQRFASNPEFLMRFTREALSAAQLTHHNIVQVHDVGMDKGVHYISMEFVKGENLGDHVREGGKMDLESAAGFILQAARGLKYAHERGIVHRDIKPDNLMVNEHGLVKIADLGLAKMKGVDDRKITPIPGRRADSTLMARAKGDLTEVDIAMGTPAYMPPEQAQDASKVDHRADQYSLGCTLYYLCAGRAPFSGASAMEIISQHITEPPPPLDKHVRRVPSALNAIITKTLEKEPADRYPSMAGVISDLEAYLGVESEKGAYTPREQHVETLELESLTFYNASASKTRRAMIAAFFVLMPLLTVGLLLGRNAIPSGATLAAASLGVLILTPLANFLLDGLFNKTFLFRRVRSVFFGMSLLGWAWTAAATLMFAAFLYIFQPVSWLASAMAAFGFALIYQKAVARKLRLQRAGCVAELQQMLKVLRIRGVSEEALQDFVYRFSDADWEELFEELFGYGAMIFARTRWAMADRIKPRKRFAVWRDPIARWLDDVEAARKRRRERKELARAETERLKAKGIDEKLARRRADETAAQTFDEGLIKTVVLEPGKTEAGEPGKGIKIAWDAAPTKGSRFTATSRLNTIYQITRLAFGVGLCLLWLAPKVGIAVPLPGPLGMLEPFYHGAQETLAGAYGLAAGVAVLISAFSTGKIMPTVALLGALLLVGHAPIAERIANEQFTSDTAFWTGLGATGIGIGMCFLDKLTGGKF